MKIGRNDKCPCGSGKKYKKCCIHKQSVFDMKTAKPAKKKDDAFFDQNNSFDLVQTIAGLSIIPQNHGKNVRMELLAHEIIKAYNTRSKIASTPILKSFVDKGYPSNHQEDPVVNQFTDLITFYGGDYLIFPGITETGSFILSNLLGAIFHWPDSKIPKNFKNNCIHASLLLLNISNTIANRLGYGRYQDGEAKETTIYFPDTVHLEKLKSAVTFSSAEMNRLLGDEKIDKEALYLFLIDVNSPDFSTQHIEESPLLCKPILFKDGKYVIVSPTTISYALTHFIWSEAERQGCMKEVNDAYHSVLWNKTQLYLGQMGFSRLDIGGVPSATSLPIRDGIYQFDDDKIAYVQLVFDLGKNFNKTARIKPTEPFEKSPTIDQHKGETIKKLLGLSQYKGFQVLDFMIISSIGRDYFYFPISRIPNARSLAIPIFEFDVLCNLKDANALSLWKFSIAREEQLQGIPIINFSFLDQYNMFKDHEDSFYLSDETKFNFIQVEVGYSSKLVREAKLGTDKHSVLREKNGRLADVGVELKDKYAPIYIDIIGIRSSEFEFMVGGFNQAVWVTPRSDVKDVSGELRGMYWEINDDIAYWLWQIQDVIKEDLKPLGDKPLTVLFDLINKGKFENLASDFKREENLSDKFRTSATPTTFCIEIPSEIIPYLYGADNEADRCLVRNLILGLNKLLLANKLPLISAERIIQIVEEKAPLGMKKKLSILDTGENLLLDPRNVGKHRYVQKYDTSIVLDSIVPKLGKNCPPVGDLASKKSKNDLTLSIGKKALLPMLRETINQYDSTVLLKRLFSLNESLIKKRAELRISTPTRIACYVSVEQHQIDLHEILGALNRTTLAVRCLIEHIAAEPSKGNRIVSQTAIDELIAIMDQAVAWGALGDQIHFDLFDIEMGILPTGRVGTNKTQSKEIFDPYFRSKTTESIQDSIVAFKQTLPPSEDGKIGGIVDNLDKAFLADYGISFFRICEFIDGLAHIAFLQSSLFASFPLSKLRDEVNRYMTSFEKDEFQNAIAYLGLYNRGKVDKLPNGYGFIDIMPWRFNRMLSLMRKPLVVVDEKTGVGDKMVYWGARQVISSKFYLIDQCESGRLRVLKGEEITKILGKFANKRGDALVRDVVASINSEGLIIDTDVYIGPNFSLKHVEDIGDIDVLIIDPQNELLFSIECKNMAPSRNIREMLNEVNKLFGEKNEKGWLDKHVERHEWIEANREQINTKYNLDISDFEIKSFFVTQEDMLTPYLKKRKLPVPFVTSYEIKEMGLSALIKEV